MLSPQLKVIWLTLIRFISREQETESWHGFSILILMQRGTHYSPAQFSLLAGLASGAVMISFFLCSRLMHFDYISRFCFLNIALILPAVWLTARHLHRQRNSNYPYLPGLSSGMKKVTVAAVLANLFILLDLRFLDQLLKDYLHMHDPLGDYMSPLVIAIVLPTEQVCGGLIISLIVMQLYKPTTG